MAQRPSGVRTSHRTAQSFRGLRATVIGQGNVAIDVRIMNDGGRVVDESGIMVCSPLQPAFAVLGSHQRYYEPLPQGSGFYTAGWAASGPIRIIASTMQYAFSLASLTIHDHFIQLVNPASGSTSTSAASAADVTFTSPLGRQDPRYSALIQAFHSTRLSLTDPEFHNTHTAWMRGLRRGKADMVGSTTSGRFHQQRTFDKWMVSRYRHCPSSGGDASFDPGVGVHIASCVSTIS
ncbi:hypothetical protein QFC24_000567 [Naganishia onofrii]|uniref:Uncharacterized protein n=1 Tax=Naganishia onofrii TaxID=1851511 RepID=A0ACC2XWA2_9TREE|nr:hypothetical protein QFC24_000567 [Naganishia onofrii]